MDPRTMLMEAKQNWQPPPELQRSSPREVRLTGAGRVLAAFAVLLLVSAPLGAVLLYLKAASDRDARRELTVHGTNVPAAVTRRWIRRGDHPRYFVDYSYEVGVLTLTGRIDVSRGSWERLSEGSALAVRYLPADTRRHLVLGYEETLMPLWVPYLVAGAMALGSWLTTLPLSSQRRLLSEGRPAPGVVTRHRRVGQSALTHYAFLTLSGAVGEGKSQAKRNPLPVGSRLCILYEQDNVRRNHPYPLSLYQTR